MNGNDFAKLALLQQAKVDLFDWLMEAIEVHQDNVVDFGADADDDLYHVYDSVRKRIQEIKSDV